jgi:hypothetical protein
MCAAGYSKRTATSRRLHRGAKRNAVSGMVDGSMYCVGVKRESAVKKIYGSLKVLTAPREIGNRCEGYTPLGLYGSDNLVRCGTYHTKRGPGRGVHTRRDIANFIP